MTKLAPAVGLALVLWAGGAAGQAGFPRFSLPFAFGVGPGGGIAVLEDRAARVVRVRPGEAAGRVEQLESPKAVAVDPLGAVLVLDRRGDRWVLEIRDGAGSRSVVLQGDDLPTDPVDMDAREEIAWILDRAPPRVFLLGYDGVVLAWTPLDARTPFSIALGPSGEAFVTDPSGPSLLSLSPAGEFLGRVPLDGTGMTRPTGVAVDSRGTVWVSDGVLGIVVGIDPKGGRRHLPAPEEGWDPLRLRWRDGLYVLDGRRGRVGRLETEGP